MRRMTLSDETKNFFLNGNFLVVFKLRIVSLVGYQREKEDVSEGK